MRNNCLNCGGSGCVPDKGARWWQFWRVTLCEACGGDGYAKPPRPSSECPVSSPPPPPPYLLREGRADTAANRRPVTCTRPSVQKGNQNPDNTSDARPAAPLGSGGQAIASCKTCRFWHRATDLERSAYVETVQETLGFCHRRSPIQRIGSGHHERWPMALAMESCGEYQAVVNGVSPGFDVPVPEEHAMPDLHAEPKVIF